MTSDPSEPRSPEPATAAPSAGPATYVGLFDCETWPERLIAHVVGPDPVRRIRGYDVAGDLARHYGVAEVAWLALHGELPAPEQCAAFEVALVLLAPVHVGEAPAHAALLSRLGGAQPGATIAIGAIGLGELAAHERAELAPWLGWLDGGAGLVPEAARARAPSPEAAEAQDWLDQRMRVWFGPDGGLPDVPLTRVACAYAVLHRLGMRAPLSLDTVTVWARLLVVIAEASYACAGAIRSYPARVPDFQYVDPGGASP